MKVLFLFPYPLGESPSQRFRFEQYFPLLRQRGIEFHTQSFWNLPTWTVLYRKGHLATKIAGVLTGFIRRIGILFQLGRYSLVFIHREAAPLGPPVIEWLIAKVFRKKIVFDFDDAIWLPNTSDENRFIASVKWHSKVASICRWSACVSAGNDYLAAYARQYNDAVVVNPTTIDTEGLHLPPKTRSRKDRVVIGWTGTHSTLPYLLPVIPVIEKLTAKFPHVVLHVISNQPPPFSKPFTFFKAWKKESEIRDLLEFDIGIMPLEDDPWSHGKCGFKALQYMALEIPTVASPVGVNTTFIDHGVNGFLCKTESDWVTCIEQLVQDKVLRERVGRQGRVTVVQRYSVLSNSSTFIALLENAVKQLAREK